MCDDLTVATWHPLLATREDQPGIWDMLTPDGEPYGHVEIRRAGEHLFYRCLFGDAEPIQTRTCRAATTLTRRAYISVGFTELDRQAVRLTNERT